MVVEFENPADGVNVVEEEVRRLCKSCGFVVDVYCPGRSWTVTGTPGADTFAPIVTLEKPCKHCPATQTTETEDCATADATKKLRIRKRLENMVKLDQRTKKSE